MSDHQISRAAEEQRLAHTLKEVHRQIEALQEALAERRGQVVATRAEMWQDLPHVIQDFDEVVEFSQHQQLLDRQERDYVFYRNLLPRLERMADSPYFGRIDFKEDGSGHPSGQQSGDVSSQSEAYYIGIASLVEEATGEHLVYDWRAPISGMFYDFEPGPAHYKAAGGIITGELTLKRQYKIVKGVLEYLFDTDVKIDDDVLQEILGKNVDRRMRAIVQSIQREQNQIIRDESHGLLVVQGPAGSGKTSIALHRVAYFLYRYRQTMGPEHIAVLSPNEIFNDYISNVLPELGEENMRQLTFQEVASRFLNAPVESLADQMEYLLARRGEKYFSSRTEGMAFKGSSVFLEILKRYIAHIEQGIGLPLKDVVFHGKTVIDRGEMIRLLRETYAYLPFVKRLEKLKRRILYLLEPYQERRMTELIAELEKDPNHNRSSRRELRRKARSVINEEIRPIHQQIDRMTSLNALDLYRALFGRSRRIKDVAKENELPKTWDAIAGETRFRLAQGYIGYEDVAPLLYLKLALGEADPMEDIQHVVVDESQDYSPVHLAAMRHLFSKATFTLLGDANQAVHPFVHAPALTQIDDAFDEKGAHIVRLTRSYRNTQEIAAFSKAILEAGPNPGEPIDPIERSGPKPELIQVTRAAGAADSGHATDTADTTDAGGSNAAGASQLVDAVVEGIDALNASGCETVAVICKTAVESEAVYAAVHTRRPVTLLTKDDHAFTRGNVIIPSYLAKGLEFDGVIVYDVSASAYNHEDERKVLYTACTRALHRLLLFYQGEMSPLLAAVDPDLYEHKTRATQ